MSKPVSRPVNVLHFFLIMFGFFIALGVVLHYVIIPNFYLNHELALVAHASPVSSQAIIQQVSQDQIRRTTSIAIHGQPLQVEVVASAHDTQEGLSDRKSMPLDHGMLFLFAKSDIYPFWMNRMYFPLDMIWFQDGKVVDIAYNMQAPPNFQVPPELYTPKVKANMVLEINAGQARALNLTIGDQLTF